MIVQFRHPKPNTIIVETSGKDCLVLLPDGMPHEEALGILEVAKHLLIVNGGKILISDDNDI